MIVVFSPQTGARAELSRMSTGSTEWTGTVSLRGRCLLDATAVSGSTLSVALEALTDLAAKVAPGRSAEAIRDLRHEV
jgi:hypothetical protein